MIWKAPQASRRGALAMAGALLVSTLGAIGCHTAPPPPPPREGFALTDKFFDVKSVGNKSFLLLGYRSSLSRSNDGGQTWKTLTSPTRRNMTRLGFADGKTGWGVGHEGIVYKTENSGDAWTEQKSGTKNALFDVAVTGPQSAWAVGDVSTILHTTDGGNTWTAYQKRDGTPGLEISTIGVREDMTLAISDPIFYGISLRRRQHVHRRRRVRAGAHDDGRRQDLGRRSRRVFWAARPCTATSWRCRRFSCVQDARRAARGGGRHVRRDRFDLRRAELDVEPEPRR